MCLQNGLTETAFVYLAKSVRKSQSCFFLGKNGPCILRAEKVCSGLGPKMEGKDPSA